jgi:hypothetical protein
MAIEERLRALGIRLPEASNPAANYSNCVQTGSLLFVSGKGPLAGEGGPPRGKLGREFSTEQGYGFARSVLGATSLRAGLPIVIESIFEVG